MEQKKQKKKHCLAVLVFGLCHVTMTLLPWASPANYVN